MKTGIYFQEIWETENRFIIFFFLKNFYLCVLAGSYVKYDLQFPEVSGLLLTFNSIADS